MAYQLSNGMITVDIAEPGDYRETRFEWNGMITGIALNEGGHTFCIAENLNPEQQQGGIGLCHEFGIKEAIGYQEAEPGEPFPKLGVGVLTRIDEKPYLFHRDYPVQPYKVEVEQEDACRITFRTLPEACRGYAALLEKTISIEGQRLSIEYTLHNTGEKLLSTEEYCHNFLNIDGYDVGPDYRLDFPVELQPEADEEETLQDLLFSSGTVQWKKVPDREFYFRSPGFDGRQKPYLWELRHVPSGTGVRETSKLEVSYAALWGRSYVVAPELFVKVEAAPGESVHWTRTYEFFSEKKQ